MSHFVTAVISTSNDESAISGMLAPYDENLHVPTYTEYTKQEFIKELLKSRTNYATKGPYADYIKNPNEYIKKNKNNSGHIEFITKTFPKILKMSGEELYQRKIKEYNPEKIGSNGEILSNYNPNSKWDWYEIGGRWNKPLLLYNGKMTNSARILKIDWKRMKEKAKSAFSIWAVLDNTGWHEPGNMGWWGISSAEPADESKWSINWEKTFITTENKNKYITIVDCHI